VSWINRLKDFFGTPAAPQTGTPIAVSAKTPPPLPQDKPDYRALILSGKTPGGLEFKNLNLSGATQAFALPPGLRCFSIDLSGSGVTSIPADIAVEFKLNLSNCPALMELPAGLKTGSLLLNGCTGLTSLPENLSVNFLSLDGCSNLTSWPETASVQIGSLRARQCAKLESLPSSLKNLTNLDLAGCTKIRRLPEGLRLTGWLDLAGTGIESLPESLRGVQLRWRGVEINPQIAFFPETLTAMDILGEANVEVRRVMLERRGLESFFHECNAEVVDQDTDPGGMRKLLKIPLPNDEDLVCVSLICPSTGRNYIVRVPPNIRTCHAAVAWTAGFDNPADYRPIIET